VNRLEHDDVAVFIFAEGEMRLDPHDAVGKTFHYHGEAVGTTVDVTETDAGGHALLIIKEDGDA